MEFSKLKKERKTMKIRIDKQKVSVMTFSPEFTFSYTFIFVRFFIFLFPLYYDWK